MKKVLVCIALVTVVFAVAALTGCDNMNKGSASITMRNTTRTDMTDFSDVASTVREGMSDAKETLKDAAETVKDGVQSAGRAAERAAEKASEKLSDAME